MDALTGQQKEITFFLHDWLTMQFDLEAKYRFKIPFYYQQTWICYLNPIKKDGIEFNFVRARELSLHQGILDFKKRVMVAGISLYDVKSIPMIPLTEIVEEAILLDQTKPYTFKKKH
jgi:hypothetical protein